MLQRLLAIATWALPAVVLSVAVARGSVWIQQSARLSVLLPVIVGIATGAIVFGLGRFANESNSKLLMAGAIVAAGVCAAAEHGFFYADYLLNFARQSAHDAKLQWLQTVGGGEATEFVDFMLASAQRPGFIGLPGWVWWMVHAVVIAATAAVTVWLLSRERPPTTAS